MTDDRTLERAARSWLEEGPTRAPDRPVEAALASIQTTRQERDLWVSRRLPFMYRTTRLTAAALVAVVAIAGSLYLFGRPISPGPQATPTPSPAVSPTGNLGACRLITSTEAATLVGDVGLGALPGQTGTGDQTTCVYSDGGGNLVLRLDYLRTGGGAAFVDLSAQDGLEVVTGLGDGAVYDPATGELHLLEGDSLLTILPTARPLAARLTVGTAIAELALPRM